MQLSDFDITLWHI